MGATFHFLQDPVDDPVDRTPSLSNSDNSGGFTPPLPQTPVQSDVISPPSDLEKGNHFPRVRSQPSSPSGVAHHRSRTLTSFLPIRPHRVTLLATVKYPLVLANLLQHIVWQDFLSFSQTCRESRKLFDPPELKDVILAHFLPGYRFACRNRDPHRFQDVPVTLHDLNLLLISQKIPLHQYPMHALSVLCTTLPSLEQDQFSAKLATFTQAHSRFVLLLQSLVHSSPSPVPLEPFEDQWRTRLAQSTMRELTFPAPLAYTLSGKIHNVSTRRKTLKRPISKSGVGLSEFGMPRNAQNRRVSVFGSVRFASPPPPASEPRAFREYSNSWRRTWRSSSCDDFSKLIPHSHLRFASSTLPSDLSLNAHPLRRNSVIMGNFTQMPFSSSPHDLQMATSRSRAPILRVFIPCSELSEEAIIECENQLSNTGLWDHLSTGDIICNLGFVPSATPDESGSLDSGDDPRRTWLVFNGDGLVPFSPPEPPPFGEPLALPSPFYYTHLLPPLVNPLYIFRIPACDDNPRLSLEHTVAKVRSPHSPNGHAMVKKYVWTARVWRRNFVDDIGEGWMGEWILEGEGTEEGKLVLLNCLKGCEARMEWEFVREKSGGGRVWLKLLRPANHIPGQ